MTLQVKIYCRKRLAWFTPAVLQGLAQVLPVLGGKRLSLEIKPMTGIDPGRSSRRYLRECLSWVKSDGCRQR